MMKHCIIAPDVKLGKNVKLFFFVNLYGCEIEDNTKIRSVDSQTSGARKWDKYGENG